MSRTTTHSCPLVCDEAGQSRGDKPKAPKLSSDAILKREAQWLKTFEDLYFVESGVTRKTKTGLVILSTD